jgi:membrane protein required for colicin V production
MTPIDFIIAAIIIVSMLFGAIRGFLRESIALLGWLTGLWLAWRYSPLLEPYIGGTIAGTELQVWLARIIVLLSVVLAAWLIGSLLGFIVQRSGLTLGIDRILGALFGMVRGAVIVGFAVMLALAADMRNEPWWKASKLIPVGEDMASILRGYVETGKQLVQDLPATGI